MFRFLVNLILLPFKIIALPFYILGFVFKLVAEISFGVFGIILAILGFVLFLPAIIFGAMFSGLFKVAIVVGLVLLLLKMVPSIGNAISRGASRVMNFWVA